MTWFMGLLDMRDSGRRFGLLFFYYPNWPILSTISQNKHPGLKLHG